MAHFAQLISNDSGELIVDRVIVVDDKDLKRKALWDPFGLFTGKEESEQVGISFCKKLLGKKTVWRQCSYDSMDGIGFRGNYPGPGMVYMTNVETLGVASTDIFIDPQPFPSWSIGINTAQWYSPLGAEPVLTNSERDAGKTYIWDEDAYNADTNSPKTVGWALT